MPPAAATAIADPSSQRRQRVLLAFSRSGILKAFSSDFPGILQEY
jgi:hypothetical protein